MDRKASGALGKLSEGILAHLMSGKGLEEDGLALAVILKPLSLMEREQYLAKLRDKLVVHHQLLPTIREALGEVGVRALAILRDPDPSRLVAFEAGFGQKGEVAPDDLD